MTTPLMRSQLAAGRRAARAASHTAARRAWPGWLFAGVVLLVSSRLLHATPVPAGAAGPAAPALVRGAATAGSTADQPLVRVSFSQLHFASVNQNDAYAALRVYTETLAGQGGFTTDGPPAILNGIDAIARVIRLNQADLLSLTTEEFLLVEDGGLVGPLLVTGAARNFTEEYLLLVREDSSIRKVEDLQGGSLMISSDVRSSLARMWLEVLLHQHGLGAASEALKRITPAAKPTRVILPVFFRQADACVVTRNSFNVMVELNPQLKKQLRAVAVSQPVVPALSCFRRGFSEPLKNQLIEAALASHTQPSFRQVMALFKTERLSAQPISVLDSARELFAAYRRLGATTKDVAVRLPDPRIPRPQEGQNR